MGKPNETDASDSYDLYGNEFLVPIQDADSPTTTATEPLSKRPITTPLSLPGISVLKQELPSTLPAKPESPLSYSAQIAAQFRQYQQNPRLKQPERTPSSEQRSSASILLTSPTEADVNRPSDDPVRPLRPSDMKDEGKLFIGGLNWDTTDEGLRNYFSQFGKVDASLIMRDADGRSRGFAFLTFEDPACVNAVMAREHVLDGKTIDPKRAIPRDEHLRSVRYFVGGLSSNTTSESMREFFSAYGKVVDATVMVDRDTGRSKGFGFATFEDSSNGEQFVGKLGLILDGKQIEVRMAQPRSQRDTTRATNTAAMTTRDNFFHQQESRTPTTSVPFMPSQPVGMNPMSMLYQRSLAQMPMMAGAMPMMGINPMAMGLGMNGAFNPIGGMGMMGMGMNGMHVNPMAAAAAAAAAAGLGPMSLGGMRLGMGPIGMTPGGMMGTPSAGVMPGAMMAGLNNPGMRMRPGMGVGGGGGVNPQVISRSPTAGTASAGTGPARATSRGQYNYHPYAR